MSTDDSSVECPFCVMMKAFGNHPVGRHLRAAQREFLMAARSVLDARIESLKDEAAAEAKKVNVE